MTRGRLNEFQKDILKVYRETFKLKRTEDFGLSRQEISRSLFKRPVKTQWKWKLFSREAREAGKQTEKALLDKMLDERKLPHKLETEKEAWTRRSRGQEKFMGDWKERTGLKSSLRGIYSKKQDTLRRSLKDLVRKGYMEKSGSGVSGNYRLTEKARKVRLPKF